MNDKIKLSESVKDAMIKKLAKGLKASYGDVTQDLKVGIPLLFKHFEENPNKEYSGDIILMFVQEQLKAVYDAGYCW